MTAASIFMFVGALAAIASYLAITRQLPESIAGATAFILWAIWSLWAQRVTHHSAAGTHTATYTELTAVGVALAAVMFVFTVQAVFGRLAPRERTRYGGD